MCRPPRSEDKTFLNANILLDKAFAAKHISHRFAIYPGGHAKSLWERWAPLWLGYALACLDAPAP